MREVRLQFVVVVVDEWELIAIKTQALRHLALVCIILTTHSLTPTLSLSLVRHSQVQDYETGGL